MDYTQLVEDLRILLTQFKQEMIVFLPNFVSALLVFLIGILIARLVKFLVMRFLKKLPEMFPNERFQEKIKELQPDRSAALIGNFLFWIILFFFLTASTEILGLPVITAWLSSIVKYLPKLLIAVLIVFLGIIGGNLVRDLVTATTDTAGVIYGDLVAKLIQYAIIFISALIAIEQIGIDIAVLSGLIYIFSGAFLFGAALAFGLGAKTAVSNILASYYLQNRYHEGQNVRIGEINGEITEFTPTAVILKTSQGETYIPAKEFGEMTSILLKK